MFEPVEHLQDPMSYSEADRADRLRNQRVGRELARIVATLGAAIHEERRRRHISLREIARLARVGLGTAHAVEAGNVCALETYIRLADALRLKAEFELADPRRRDSPTRRAVDPVHAAMGEAQASHLRALGFEVGLDEPFQHYHFAGRADLVAWSVERQALLHIENKTRIPDLQDCFGSFNAKRTYLGDELAARLGVGRWRSETHVMAALWSGETLPVLRAHAASFASVFPQPVDAFETWWRGVPPDSGRHRVVVIFDPAKGTRKDRRQWLGAIELPGVRPRYRDYAEAVSLLKVGRT